MQQILLLLPNFLMQSSMLQKIINSSSLCYHHADTEYALLQDGYSVQQVLRSK